MFKQDYSYSLCIYSYLWEYKSLLLMCRKMTIYQTLMKTPLHASANICNVQCQHVAGF